MLSKKELKEAYKAMKFRTGIFQIKNIQENKIFLAISNDLDRAFNSDQFKLKSNTHSNRPLQNDWNTLGEENFEFSIFDEIELSETASSDEIKKELKELLSIHTNDLKEKGQLFY